MASSTIPRPSSIRSTRMIITTALGDMFTITSAALSMTPMTEAVQVKMPAKTTMNMITELVTAASTSISIMSRHRIDR